MRAIPERPDRDALLADLRRLILSGAPAITDDLSDGAPLITSGLLESTALLDVVLWVEDRIGAAIDLGDVDLATEWDSMGAIVSFVDRHHTSRATPVPPSV